MKWTNYDVEIAVDKDAYIERTTWTIRAVSRAHALRKALKINPDAFEATIKEYTT